MSPVSAEDHVMYFLTGLVIAALGLLTFGVFMLITTAGGLWVIAAIVAALVGCYLLGRLAVRLLDRWEAHRS